MRDDFELLKQLRRPWLDPEELKSRFHKLSSDVHPDRFHNAKDRERDSANTRYAELNSAYTRLRDPRDRVLHLLELELDAKPKAVQAPPRDITELGFEVGQLCHQVDRFLSEQSKVSSPMLKVQLFEQAQAWSERLMEVKASLSSRQERLVEELKAMNPAWEAAEQSTDRKAFLPLARLEEIYTLLSYLNRWISQMQERIVQLCL